jgi:hypothetical protein
MAFDGRGECVRSGGTCTDAWTEWTESCTEEASMQEVADQRNAADAECPSDDRHDCDGDGVHSAEDANDDDPQVH